MKVILAETAITPGITLTGTRQIPGYPYEAPKGLSRLQTTLYE